MPNYQNYAIAMFNFQNYEGLNGPQCKVSTFLSLPLIPVNLSRKRPSLMVLRATVKDVWVSCQTHKRGSKLQDREATAKSVVEMGEVHQQPCSAPLPGREATFPLALRVTGTHITEL